MQSSLALAEPITPVPLKLVSASALRVQLHHDDAALEALHYEWDELLDHSAQDSFFLRWAWVRLWWDTYAPPGSRLYLLTARDDAGKLLGLAPLYWQPRRFFGIPHLRDLNFLGTGIAIKSSEHLDIFARRGFERAAATAFAEFLRQRSDWDRLWLWGISGQSKMLSSLQEAFGEQLQTRCCDRRYYVATDSDWESVKQGWSGPIAHSLERYLKKLRQDYTVEFDRVETAAELETAFADFIRLHQARWTAKGESGAFRYPKFEAFLRTASQQALHQDRLRFWQLRLNGETTAVLLAFLNQGVVYGLQSGFDIKLQKYSLGSILIAYCLQDAVNDPQIRQFDLMGGNSTYKSSWTSISCEAYELEIFRSGFRTLLYLGGTKTRKLLSHLRRAARNHLQRPATTD